MKASLIVVVALLLFLPNAALADNEKFAKLCEQFLYESLARSPNLASASGYHKHVDSKTGKTIELDAELDDFSQEHMQDQIKFYEDWRKKFASEVALDKLDHQELTDWKLIDHEISLNLLQYSSIKTYLHDPSLLGRVVTSSLIQTLRNPNVSREVQQQNLVSRLKQIPGAVEQVKKYLNVTSPFLIENALGQNGNLISTIELTLPKYFPDGAEQKPHFEYAAHKAVQAVREYSNWLQSKKSDTGSDDAWRLGKELFDKKFVYDVCCSETPDQILAVAQKEFNSVRARMFLLAEEMHKEMFPQSKAPAKESEADRQYRIISEVLNQISLDHPYRYRVVEKIQKDLVEIRKFVDSKKIVGMNKRKNLRVVPVENFDHWSTFAGMNSPPPLEPQGIADFWVMPISSNMTDEKAESLLREYNNTTLKWLIIHEALPGHYIRGEHLNELLPVHRRLLRAVFKNHANMEGWAEYVAQVMLDEGFMKDSSRYRLVMHKVRLRLMANAILDIKLHTAKMSDKDALDLLIKGAFQNEAEAHNKLHRAKSGSCHLSCYYVGLREWQKLRQKFQAAKGKDFNQFDFHNKALDQGPLPMPLLDELLLTESELKER